MSTSKKGSIAGPIVYVDDFVENRGMKSLIESQAKTQMGTTGNNQVAEKNAPKVKKRSYVRINQPKK